MKELPEGTSLGWMQAPASWINSHTVRFIGLVRVVIHDGEGYILIKKGKPLFHYFRHGTIELKGHTALDYFNSHPVIEFNLCKYTPDEFSWALKVCNIEDEPEVRVPAAPGPAATEHSTPSRPVDPMVLPKPVGNKRGPDPVVVLPQVRTGAERAAASGPVTREYIMESRPVDPMVLPNPAGNKRSPEPVVVPPQVRTAAERTAVSGPVAREHSTPSRPADPPIPKPADQKRSPSRVVVPPQVLRVGAERAVELQPPAADDPDVSYTFPDQGPEWHCCRFSIQ